jgi:hypothetical protein
VGTKLKNVCSRIEWDLSWEICVLCYVSLYYVSILTHTPPSPPFLTFGARHSHGCGRLYACSPPGGTQCQPFTVHVLVINTTTTTVVAVAPVSFLEPPTATLE